MNKELKDENQVCELKENNIKKAFDIFFNKMNESWKTVWNTYPKTSFRQENDICGLYISKKVENGYVEWQPRLQVNDINFQNIEKILDYKIHPDIKKYMSAYWFFRLNSSLENDVHFQLKDILPNCDMEKEILDRFKKERFHYKKDGEYFLLGECCCIEGDDSYSLQVNNITGEVIAVQPFDEEEIKIASSIEELLKNMRGEWD